MAVRQIEPIDRAELRATIQKWIDAHTDVDELMVSAYWRMCCGKSTHSPPSPPQNEWVSVYDRLPEPGERVLATDCGFVGEFTSTSVGNGSDITLIVLNCLWPWDILYWMPLPKSPKEDE